MSGWRRPGTSSGAPGPDDGRAKRLWLTEEGRRVAERVGEASLEPFSRLMETMEETDVARVIVSISTLNRALKSSFEKAPST